MSLTNIWWSEDGFMEWMEAPHKSDVILNWCPQKQKRPWRWWCCYYDFTRGSIPKNYNLSQQNKKRSRLSFKTNYVSLLLSTSTNAKMYEYLLLLFWFTSGSNRMLNNIMNWHPKVLGIHGVYWKNECCFPSNKDTTTSSTSVTWGWRCVVASFA